jgi:glucokinase
VGAERVPATGPPNEHGEFPALRVGLDIGGTKIHGVLLGPDNAVLAELRAPTVPGVSGLVAQVGAVIDGMLVGIGATRRNVSAIGLGVPGLVDASTGAVIEAVNMGFSQEAAPLARLIGIGFPDAAIAVENDVNAAAVGARALLYPDIAELALLSIGTGLAAGIIANGQLLRGASGAAGEIGHIAIHPEGLLCGCGQRGCLETVCSGAAISRAWGAQPGADAALEVFDAADRGEALAVAIRREFVAAMATTLTLLALTSDPQIILVGGGVSSLGERLLQPVRDRLNLAASSSSLLTRLGIAGKLVVLPATVPVAAIGAALIARSSVTAHPFSAPSAETARESAGNRSPVLVGQERAAAPPS